MDTRFEQIPIRALLGAGFELLFAFLLQHLYITSTFCIPLQHLSPPAATCAVRLFFYSAHSPRCFLLPAFCSFLPCCTSFESLSIFYLLSFRSFCTTLPPPVAALPLVLRTLPAPPRTAVATAHPTFFHFCHYHPVAADVVTLLPLHLRCSAAAFFHHGSTSCHTVHARLFYHLLLVDMDMDSMVFFYRTPVHTAFFSVVHARVLCSLPHFFLRYYLPGLHILPLPTFFTTLR